MKDSHLVQYDPVYGSAYSLPESRRFKFSTIPLNFGKHIGWKSVVNRIENK